MNIDDEIDTVAAQAWHKSRSVFSDEELEAYLRKHTLNGKCREMRDAWIALGHAVVRDLAATWLRILDMLGM